MVNIWWYLFINFKVIRIWSKWRSKLYVALGWIKYFPLQQDGGVLLWICCFWLLWSFLFLLLEVIVFVFGCYFRVEFNWESLFWACWVCVLGLRLHPKFPYSDSTVARWRWLLISFLSAFWCTWYTYSRSISEQPIPWLCPRWRIVRWNARCHPTAKSIIGIWRFIACRWSSWFSVRWMWWFVFCWGVGQGTGWFFPWCSPAFIPWATSCRRLPSSVLWMRVPSVCPLNCNRYWLISWSCVCRWWGPWRSWRRHSSCLDIGHSSTWCTATTWPYSSPEWQFGAMTPQWCFVLLFFRRIRVNPDSTCRWSSSRWRTCVIAGNAWHNGEGRSLRSSHCSGRTLYLSWTRILKFRLDSSTIRSRCLSKGSMDRIAQWLLS